ncbi:WD40-repeat-containing domain protein [Apodospora peruviana]|uniref:WD40-repeat-containing domain protein n=1 Tax=Apodospora peruviana TaxID=516989 RepID=A0AAE0HY87_9PEZI|nr:WD40-repeat-containing domain protein [Apodospora peruviana]
MKELLDTDRVNFLVWRYLLESNYRETAAKLQKEWRIRAPHQQFDFAPHVHNYALVSLLNKGLVYEDFQREFDAVSQQVPHDVPATVEATARGVFGPLKFEPAPNDAEDEDESEQEPEELNDGSRKRPMDRQHHGLPNGSPANKRQRLLSNGCENGADSATTPMDIDNGPDNNHAYPSPLEGEQAVSPLPHTEGPEQGTQVEKVHELTPETVFLQLGGAESSAASPTRANENPIVLHCEWNPQNPSILAAAGTDALARVWTVSRGAATPQLQAPDSESLPDHVDSAGTLTTRPFKNLLEDEVSRNATVSAMAWNWSGDAISLAVENDGRARICIWGLDGTIVRKIDGVEPPVIKLRWSPNNDFILGISPENRGTLITIYSSSKENSMSHLLSDHELVGDLDAAWISDTEFILCGGDCLIGLRCTEDKILPGREFHTGKDEAFSQVQFDWRTKLIATATEKGIIDLWDESGQRKSISAHMGLIPALQWQPLKAEPAEDERLLASGGEDGAICIWNVRSPESKPKYSMTMSLPILGLSMTPDGAFIAGATSDKILIWKVGEHAIPRASWSRVPHPGWQSPSPKANPETEEDFLPCLGWNAEGQKLVYGANGRVSTRNAQKTAWD